MNQQIKTFPGVLNGTGDVLLIKRGDGRCIQPLITRSYYFPNILVEY